MIAKLAVAALCIVGAAGLAWAQSTSTKEQFIELRHGGPYPGAPAPGPAMSLMNVPLHPAEATGLVRKLNYIGRAGNIIHIRPTIQVLAARAKAGVGRAPGAPIGQACPPTCSNLTYHSGGSVMLPYVAVYLIYWDPPNLQSGAATGFSANYGTPTILGGAWLPGHGIMNIATQYFQSISNTTTYINNGGGLGGYFVDHGGYPQSGSDCSGEVNCVGDAQAQAKIASVMAAQGWTGGMNRIFVLLTSSGEDVCMQPAACAYANGTFCAYHTFFTQGGQTVLYAIIPYSVPSGCQVPGQTTPNDAYGDLATDSMTHEIMEAATDPLLNAWFNSTGEIGDNCSHVLGTNTWGSGAGAGNQMWNGFIFEVQQEWDNHANSGNGACVQVGPL